MTQALYDACGPKGNLAVAKELLTAKADPNQAREDSQTPLLAACLYENVDTVRLLLSRGADVNKKTIDDGTGPLFVACEDG